MGGVLNRAALILPHPHLAVVAYKICITTCTCARASRSSNGPTIDAVKVPIGAVIGGG